MARPRKNPLEATSDAERDSASGETPRVVVTEQTAPEEEAPLSAQTLAEMEAGRKSLEMRSNS